MLVLAAVTLGGQRMVKWNYSSTGTGHSGNPVNLFNVRYYIPTDEGRLAIVSYRDAASEFDAKKADEFAGSFLWL